MTAVRRLDFRLTKPQTKAFKVSRFPRSDLNLEWGRGCGKSWFDRFIAWSWVAQVDGVPRLKLLQDLGILDELTDEQKLMAVGVKGIRVIFLLPTKKQFVDIHGRLLRQENDDAWLHLRGKLNGTTYQVDFPGGSFIAPFPASEHGSKRALGLRADIVIADECDDIDIDVFDTVVRPWFSEPWSLKIRVTSGTPRRGRHGLLWQRRVAGSDKDQPRYHSIHATYRDNPEIVDAKEVDDARRNTPKATFEREWECNFDSGEGLVYPFDADFHVIGGKTCPVKEVPDFRTLNEFHVGMDHGWSDPGVLVLGGVQGHGEDATLYLVDESYEREVPNHTWDERAKLWRHATFWPDPSRPDRINDLRSMGLNVRSVDNDILAGVGRVAEMLFIRKAESGERFARCYISPKCVETIREFGVYRRRKHSDGTFDEMPEDKQNHAMDSIRYLAIGRFGKAQSTRITVSGR